MATKKKPRNILVIGDLHEPFCLDGYLEFCKKVQKTYKTNHTIFIGDVIDNHFSSYHESDPDLYSAGDELKHATNRLSKWHKAFPNAEVCLGNHDVIASRKVFTAGLSQAWLKNIDDVLQVPTWKFDTSFVHDGVKYVHGHKHTSARSSCLKGSHSMVQGHRHQESYLWRHSNGRFGMQVGTGIDSETRAMAYGFEDTNVLSCAVVLDNGKLPILISYS